MEEKTFQFSAENQKHIFAALLYDDEFLKSYKGLIKPNYFDNPVLKDMAEIVIGFFEKYSRLPNKNEFLEELDTFITNAEERNKNLPTDEYLGIAEELVKIEEKDDFRYAKDKATNFIKHQAMVQAARNTPEKLEKGDYEGILHSFQEAYIAAEEGSELEEYNLGDIEPEEIKWLWQDHIPEGKLTYIVGDPGVGKSFLTTSLMKYVTTGEGWPDCPQGSREKGSVILLNVEDGMADTIVKRLDWAGADRSKITLINAVVDKRGGKRIFKLDRDVTRLEKSLRKKENVKLIIIDPVGDYLGSVDSFKESDVRGTLAPLVSLAKEHKVAVVAVLHKNKREALQALYRIAGTIGFAGVARVIWHISRDTDNEERRLFALMKNNLTARPWSELGLAFSITEGKVVWEEVPMRKSISEIFADDQKSKEKRPREKAMEFLKEVLKDSDKAQSEIEKMAEEEDFSWRTVQYAKKRLGIESYREGKKWFWSLSKEQEAEEEDLGKRVEKIKLKHAPAAKTDTENLRQIVSKTRSLLKRN